MWLFMIIWHFHGGLKQSKHANAGQMWKWGDVHLLMAKKIGSVMQQNIYILCIFFKGDGNPNWTTRMQQLWQSGHSQLGAGSQSREQGSAER